MNKFYFTLFFSLILQRAIADDLTAKVTNTSSGSNNGAVDLTVTGGVAPYTYSWKGPNSFTASTEDISGLAKGSYVVTVTDKYCGVATLVITIDIASGMHTIENTDNSFLPYPNPTSGEFIISTSETMQNAHVRIVNMSGQIVEEQSNISGTQLSIDLTKQLNGIYFIEIIQGSTISRRKVIKN